MIEPFGAPGIPTLLEGAPPLGPVLLKIVAPIVVYAAALPIIYRVFRKTWRELDADALAHRRARDEAGDTSYDYRPIACFVIAALVLTMQEYYGQPRFYDDYLRPWLRDVELAQLDHPGGLGQYVHVRLYGELYAFGWWALTRVLGYAVVPLAAWKLLFRKDSVRDMGLRTTGIVSHAWIYGVSLCIVLPCVYLASRSPEFGEYYPFYKQCSRSWADLVTWELMYVAQFFALEIFFRGFWLSALRTTLGSGAIFAMVVPYCMIHYGKPYLETCGAVLAGIWLGSLSMKTKSIYSGFALHVTIALAMDLLALAQKGWLPQRLWA
ncbi:MAG TPA: CPBP family intramembrane glutamic endopeptidase [Byssovorax sp.]